MNVLIINGSPKGLHLHRPVPDRRGLEQGRYRHRILHVGGKPVGGCIGCGGCRSGNGCVFGGVVNEAIEKAKTADGFVFGSPVHYASASGNMTSFMDRLAYAGGRYLAYKPAAVCCSARRAGTTSTLDQLVKVPAVLPHAAGQRLILDPWSTARTPSRCCRTPRAAPSCRSWAATWRLLHCIEAGKAAGFDPPQNPPAHDELHPLSSMLPHSGGAFVVLGSALPLLLPKRCTKRAGGAFFVHNFVLL